MCRLRASLYRMSLLPGKESASRYAISRETVSAFALARGTSNCTTDRREPERLRQQQCDTAR